MGRRLELRDLRSLERGSMYTIFHPLDPDERLPRELLLEGRRHRLLDVRHLEIAAALCLPALIVGGVMALGTVHLDPLIGFLGAGLLLAGFLVLIATFKNG